MIRYAGVCCTMGWIVMGSAMTCAATVGDLRCEGRDDPSGIDATKPRLSWTIASDRRGTHQATYRVLVAASPESLARDEGDLWDSGRATSANSYGIEYAGKPLTSRAQAFWKVRVWDDRQQASAWSASSRWTMGLLNQDEWKAHWIGVDPARSLPAEEVADAAIFNTRGLPWVYFPGAKSKRGVVNFSLRKQIELPVGRTIRRAVVAIYSHNLATVSINATLVGTAPWWEETSRLDVTKQLHAGANLLAITAENTDFLPAAVIGRLVVQFTAGADMQVPINATWKAAQQPSAGWDKPGYDDRVWVAAEARPATPWGTPSLNDTVRIPPPYMRKDFKIAQAVKRATVYVTALGCYELHLNGQRIGRDELTPGWSEFRKRVYYQTYDVTDAVKPGENAVGAILGDGWYASDLAFTGRRNFYGGDPRFMAQIVVELADGTTQTIASDETWKTAYGPIRHADLMLGCEYDARRQLSGWDKAGFDDASWSNVVAEESSMIGQGTKNVKAIVAAAVRGNRLAFKVENAALGGDPAVDIPKSLRVVYKLNKKLLTQVAAEHTTLEIKANPQEKLAIVRAEYGDLRVGAGQKLAVQAARAEPVRRAEELPAVKVVQSRPGWYIFDLGQNMVGWTRLQVHGKAGQRISVRHGEMLNPDGTLYTVNLRGATATDFFTLAGSGEETLEPSFTFHGFRYVELQGLDYKPEPSAVTGIVVHTAMRRTGQFECSSALVNQLYHNIIWGQKGNYLEVPTDCPQRDERAGWTGDTQFFAATAAYNFDVQPFFTRWLVTMCEDSQHADGSYAHVSPDLGLGGGATAWGDAALLCTYNTYRVYGDTRVIGEHFAALDRYMKFVAKKSTDLIPNIGGFGDWLNLGGSASREVMDTAYYAHLARLMSEMARAIGRNDDAERYAKLHADIKAAFANFFLPDGSMKNCSQTGYALAFTMDLVPDALREKAAAKYASEIERFKLHLATGFIGTPRLLPGLHAAGRDDMAYKLLLQETYPSWLFQVKLGATTMWERWDGWTPDRGFQTIGMNSFNHYSFGSVGEYLYSAVAGISADAPGYDKIRIQPVVGDGLTWAKASYDSIHGRITSSWKQDRSALTLDVAIPANTTATVYVPATEAAYVTESGKPAAQADGVKFLRMQKGAAVYEVGSGSYAFRVGK